MANDPKIDCRVRLDSSVPNTNLPELKWNMLLNLFSKGGCKEIWEMPAEGWWQRNSRQGRQSFSLVSSPTEAKVSWLWLMDNNKEALPTHYPSISHSYVLSSRCSFCSPNIWHAVRTKTSNEIEKPHALMFQTESFSLNMHIYICF